MFYILSFASQVQEGATAHFRLYGSLQLATIAALITSRMLLRVVFVCDLTTTAATQEDNKASLGHSVKWSTELKLLTTLSKQAT